MIIVYVFMYECLFIDMVVVMMYNDIDLYSNVERKHAVACFMREESSLRLWSTHARRRTEDRAMRRMLAGD